mgnify:CR=1 FL=1
MSEFTATGRLAKWDGTKPDLRDWSDKEVLDALSQLGIVTDRAQFTAAAMATDMASSLEDQWLRQSGALDEGLRTFIWLAAQDLWERWQVEAWPRDRLARMFAYLVDAEYAVEWADRCHAPTAESVMDALETWLLQGGHGKAGLDGLVELLGMPAAAWPSKLLDSMAEWSEVGRIALASRGGALMAALLGQGDAHSFMAAALVSARMYDRAKAAALQVSDDVDPGTGFDEMVGYLAVSAGDAVSGKRWLALADSKARLRRSEMTYAAEAVREFLDSYDGSEVPERMRKAALQGASQAAYLAFMGFAAHPDAHDGA